MGSMTLPRLSTFMSLRASSKVADAQQMGHTARSVSVPVTLAKTEPQSGQFNAIKAQVVVMPYRTI
jgi:hypothetical protein